MGARIENLRFVRLAQIVAPGTDDQLKAIGEVGGECRGSQRPQQLLSGTTVEISRVLYVGMFGAFYSITQLDLVCVKYQTSLKKMRQRLFLLKCKFFISR